MKNIFIAALVIIGYTSNAQQTFLNYGKIEFEKKLNLHKQIEGETWLENMKDKIPNYQTTYFNLYFKDEKTLYEKGKETNEKIPFFGDDRSVDDIIYTDLKTGTFTKKQAVFDETFLLNDSIRNVEWKINGDTREIAGFDCKKATAVILDSVFIVAFYTDQIPVSGGPLSFSNLPGMVLGVAIPRCNVTVFATKVEYTEPAATKLVAPTTKKNKTNYAGLRTTLQKALTDWGSYGRKYIISSML
jgi:GLPGLI family protein